METSRDGMAELKAAQERTHYPIVGRLFARIKYGDEKFDWHADALPRHDLCSRQRAAA